MEIDATTYEDLSIFHEEEGSSVFYKIDMTHTRGGHDKLLDIFSKPLGDLASIRSTQAIIGFIRGQLSGWPPTITNGTIMVMEKFYETPIDDIPAHPVFPNPFFYKLFHTADYSLVKFSVGHFAEFVRGMEQLILLLDREGCPPRLQALMQRTALLLKPAPIRALSGLGRELSPAEVVGHGHALQRLFKGPVRELIGIHSQLDAWHSMALAMTKWDFSMPSFIEGETPVLAATSLYHPLLANPIAYDVKLDTEGNFLFLTGANMAGKSTFIKAVGVSVFLAHLGMGVPAAHLQLSVFDGILSNITVMDDVVKGESYFFNEVQRIRNTLLKIAGNRRWLVLIDELFKGTNVQDAMKCSAVVIKGLRRIGSSLFILSTHLYEIGEELKEYKNIVFRYFETAVKGEQLEFSYQLKEGISNDRLGYLILKREKVVEMLEKL